MTTQTEALKLALEALESSNKLINGAGNHFGLEGAMDGYYSGCFDVEGNNKLLNEAITALRLAIDVQNMASESTYKAALAQQAPTGMLHIDRLDKWLDASLKERKAQRTWVGLDEKDFSAINQSCLTKLQAATSAESVLKEKNNGLL